MQSDRLNYFWEHELRPRLAGRIFWLGIGNVQRGDDGAGPALISRLADHGRWQAADAGVAPENHLEKVVAARPDTLILADAAEWGGHPGDAWIVDAESLRAGGLSTHALSLDLAAAYWSARVPGIKIWLLVIQPASLEWDSGLSPAVAETVEQLAECLRTAHPTIGKEEHHERA
ncbi:MAG: hydrogenase 3 maturation endopeptidase HyCI [candidate division FCPU426 bacterium]